MAPILKFVFTLKVDLAPPIDFGSTFSGDRRFIGITGGSFKGPDVEETIFPGGGDWNAVRSDGVVHVLAKYAIKTNDGVLINVTNEGYGRASQGQMKQVFGNHPKHALMGRHGTGKDWYTKTSPRFEVAAGKYEWMNKSVFIGDLLPPQEPNRFEIEIYEVL